MISVFACALKISGPFHFLHALVEVVTSFSHLEKHLSAMNLEIWVHHRGVRRTEWCLSVFVALDEHVIDFLLCYRASERSCTFRLLWSGGLAGLILSHFIGKFLKSLFYYYNNLGRYSFYGPIYQLNNYNF